MGDSRLFPYYIAYEIAKRLSAALPVVGWCQVKRDLASVCWLATLLTILNYIRCPGWQNWEETSLLLSDILLRRLSAGSFLSSGFTFHQVREFHCRDLDLLTWANIWCILASCHILKCTVDPHLELPVSAHESAP
jgi:hypothetical protein